MLSQGYLKTSDLTLENFFVTNFLCKMTIFQSCRRECIPANVQKENSTRMHIFYQCFKNIFQNWCSVLIAFDEFDNDALSKTCITSREIHFYTKERYCENHPRHLSLPQNYDEYKLFMIILFK